MKLADVNGYEIPTDGDDMPCLTAMWTIMGKPPTKSVSRYKQLARFKTATKFFTCYSKRGGKNPGTWASLMIALDYADYLGLTRPQPASEPESPRNSATDPEQDSSQAEHEARMREMDEEAQARRDRYQANLARDAEHAKEFQEAIRGMINGMDEGEEWKKGTIYDEPRVNRCASYMMGPDDLANLFFDFFSLRGGDVIIRCSVN